MQDKKFDQLMKDQFEDAEIAPSPGLWANIDQELSHKRKRVLPVYWMAAAISLITVGIGLFFYAGENNTPADRLVSRPVLAAVKPVIDDTLKTVPEQVIAPEAVTNVSVNPSKVKVVKNVAPVILTADKKDLTAMQPLVLNNRPDDTKLQIKQERVTLPKPAAITEEEIVLASTDELPLKDEVINENEEAAPKGIRNIGDLVNYVVDKVDKREEKVIQFKTEDDNSSLIAINIGMFKFNQRKTHK